MKPSKVIGTLSIVGMLFFAFFGCSQAAPDGGAEEKEYGVFIGAESKDIERMDGYHTVVVDAAGFSSEDVEKLHRKGHCVYTYLNIGSIETFRSYYSRFADRTLGEYENWPEERWVDVSCEEWRRFVADTLARELAGKGVDGFFLDNADVWYEYPRADIYKGLLEILKEVEKYGLPVILNGGDSFVTAALEAGDLQGLVAGVNQETVFTAIDFQKDSFGKQGAEETAYFKEYLSFCKKAGLDVYLTEYGADAVLSREIREYCRENGFFCYISKNLNLDGR